MDIFFSNLKYGKYKNLVVLDKKKMIYLGF